MIQQPVLCLQCDAPLSIMPGQRHCRCSYCGSKFVIDWPDPETAQLRTFESVLTTPLDSANARAADQRLMELEAAMANVEQQVQASQERFQRAQVTYKRALRAAHKAVALPQNATLAVGFLAAIVWFLVTFVLENLVWYVGLFAGVLLILGTICLHRQWQATQRQMYLQLQEAKRDIEQAYAHLNESLAQQEDCALEQELIQKQMSKYDSQARTSP